MKTKIIAIVLAMLMVAGVAVAADSDWYDNIYLKGGLAYTFLEDPKVNNIKFRMDDGYGYRLAVGYDFENAFRVETEWASQKNDVSDLSRIVSVYVDSSDITYETFMLNGYYDYMVTRQIGLYGMGGLGWGKVKASFYRQDDSDTGFAWKAGFGGFYDITQNWTVDLGYEYLDLNDADFSGDLDNISSSNIVGSVRYKF